MEDTLVCYTDFHGFLFAGVFDGHGGEDASHWLADHMLEELEPLIEGNQELAAPADASGGNDPFHSDALTQQWATAFKNTDDKLLAVEGIPESGSGATATIALVRSDKLVVASIGDSRAVLCRNGTASALTLEHRVMGRGDRVKAEIQRVEDAGGWIADGRVCDVLAVSRAFGDWEFKTEAGLAHMVAGGVDKGYWDQEFADAVAFSSMPVITEPEVVCVPLAPNDEFLIVASDGLWDVMPTGDVVRYARTKFRSGASAQDVSEALTDIALKRHSSDNVAVVVVDLRELGELNDETAAGEDGGAGGNGTPPPTPKKTKKRFGIF